MTINQEVQLTACANLVASGRETNCDVNSSYSDAPWRQNSILVTISRLTTVNFSFRGVFSPERSSPDEMTVPKEAMCYARILQHQIAADVRHDKANAIAEIPDICD